MYCTLSLSCVQVQTLPTAQATPAPTDSFSRGYDPHTHACKARPLTTVGWTSLSVIVIAIAMKKTNFCVKQPTKIENSHPQGALQSSVETSTPKPKKKTKVKPQTLSAWINNIPQERKLGQPKGSRWPVFLAATCCERLVKRMVRVKPITLQKKVAQMPTSTECHIVLSHVPAALPMVIVGLSTPEQTCVNVTALMSTLRDQNENLFRSVSLPFLLQITQQNTEHQHRERERSRVFDFLKFPISSLVQVPKLRAR